MGEREVLEEALRVWGGEAQARQAQEECAELIAAINRMSRMRCNPAVVAEEIADVEIMCAQLRVMLGDGLVDAAKQRKMQRLRERLEQEVQRG